jgi:uncharacterized protein YndB with AHSA1/START domain
VGSAKAVFHSLGIGLIPDNGKTDGTSTHGGLSIGNSGRMSTRAEWRSPVKIMSTSVVVDTPQAELFAFLAAYGNMTKWNYYFVSVELTSPPPIGVGSRFRQTRKTDTHEVEIVALEPGRRLVVEVLPPERRHAIEFVLKPSAGGGTEVRETWTVEAGWLGFAGPAISWALTPKFNTAVDGNLAKLKELLEKGTTTLQDGREVRMD